MIDPSLEAYRYTWPRSDFDGNGRWRPVPEEDARAMDMPERLEELAADSRWPAFFPSGFLMYLCLKARLLKNSTNCRLPF